LSKSFGNNYKTITIEKITKTVVLLFLIRMSTVAKKDVGRLPLPMPTEIDN